jgi:lipopolysaccharide biosynthesis regulator YciM
VQSIEMPAASNEQIFGENLMKRIFCLSIICLLLGAPVFAQKPKPENIKTPLDCALYLIKRDGDEYRKSEHLNILSFYYWKLGRKKDAAEAIILISDNQWRKTERLIHYGTEFLKDGQTEAAAPLLLSALKVVDIDTGLSGTDRTTTELIDGLVKLGKTREIIDFAGNLEDVDDQVFVLTETARLINDKEKSLELLGNALEINGRSRWEDIKLLAKLKAGTVYAALGEREKAAPIIETVAQNFESINFSSVSKESLIEQLVDAYAALKEFDKALNLQRRTMDFNRTDDLYKIAELNQKAGNKTDADAWLAQIAELQKSDDKNDSVWMNIINNSIKNNDFEEALDSAKKLDSEYYQFEIIDRFLESKKTNQALELLNFVLKNTGKITANEPESGYMSTSPQMRKADNFSKIAGKFIELGKFETALNIIDKIEKPYYKAQGLINLAVNQKGKNAVRLLDQAQAIIKKPNAALLDARKINAWSELAAGYAVLGQKDKAVQVFADILSDEDEIYGSNTVPELIRIGYYFEKSGLKPDTKISAALQKVIKNWEEDN